MDGRYIIRTNKGSLPNPQGELKAHKALFKVNKGCASIKRLENIWMGQRRSNKVVHFHFTCVAPSLEAWHIQCLSTWAEWMCGNMYKIDNGYKGESSKVCQHLGLPTFCFVFRKHERCLTTWLVFCQVERRFHGQESNRQPLHSGWVPSHYYLVV